MTDMIKVYSAKIQPNEKTFRPEVLFTASIPLVKLGSHIPETEGLTEDEIMQKLGRIMLEQVFAVYRASNGDTNEVV
jgi:hypothetical protein